MKEERCRYDGQLRLPQGWLSFALGLVLLLAGLCGGSLWAQPLNTTPSWSGPLSDLKQTLEQLKQKSIMQERLIASLQNDNSELKQLSIEQQTALQRQQETLRRSRNLLTEASLSWTNYLELSEEEVRNATARALRAERLVLRNRRIWQFGIPVALLGGIALGVAL